MRTRSSTPGRGSRRATPRWASSRDEGVDAETAERWGLATRIVPEGEARETAVELGQRIADFPQETVRTDRAAVYDGIGTTLERGLGVEGWHGSRALRTAREGAERFAGEGRGGDGIEERDEEQVKGPISGDRWRLLRGVRDAP